MQGQKHNFCKHFVTIFRICSHYEQGMPFLWGGATFLPLPPVYTFTIHTHTHIITYKANININRRILKHYKYECFHQVVKDAHKLDV